MCRANRTGHQQNLVLNLLIILSVEKAAQPIGEAGLPQKRVSPLPLRSTPPFFLQLPMRAQMGSNPSIQRDFANAQPLISALCISVRMLCKLLAQILF
jgi:hypothetical protein